MTKPSLTIFGIEETDANRNKFVPHYKILNRKLYPESRLVLLRPRSVMFTREAFSTFDFWNLDSDFFFAEDALSFNEMLNFGGNHFAYFSLFNKVLRIAHGHYDEDFLAQEWTKNKAHLHDILLNCQIADVVMVSPVLGPKLLDVAGSLLNSKMVKSIEEKFLVLPPPDFYKFDNLHADKSFKKLTFLWHHRFNAAKNPKLFFGTLEKLREQHPRLPFRLLVLSSLSAQELKKFVPKSLHDLMEVRPYAYDDEAYAQALLDSNITLGVSLAESYGIAILEAARSGSVVLNAECSDSYTKIVGPKTTFPGKELVSKIVRIYEDKDLRDKVLAYTNKAIANITSGRDYRKQLEGRLSDVLAARLDRTSAKSPKLQAVLKALSKRALTKNEVYEVMGWKSSGTPVNSFWGDYYYGLRKLGVQTTMVDGRLYFYKDVAPKAGQSRPVSSAKSKKGLF